MQVKLQRQTINQAQTAFNIAKQIKRAINESIPDAKEVAKNFDANSITDVCKRIFYFQKKHMPYKREGWQKQTAKTLGRIYYDINKGYTFDCKHYATHAASILKALKIPFVLRLISQNYFDKQPTHIYVVAFDKYNNEYVVDACMNEPLQEARYNYKYDLTI